MTTLVNCWASAANPNPKDRVQDLLGIDRVKVVEAPDCVKTGISHVPGLPIRM